MEAVNFYETLLPNYQTTLRHIPGDSNVLKISFFFLQRQGRLWGTPRHLFKHKDNFISRFVT
jgi:hypothetical protein